MCRSIITLRRPDRAATEEEVRAAALQFVRKVSGYRQPSRRNAEAFERAVDAGATLAKSPADLASSVEAVITIITNADAIEAMYHGPATAWGPAVGGALGALIAHGTRDAPLQIATYVAREQIEQIMMVYATIPDRDPEPEVVSHTALALAPVLAAGPFAERKPYDTAATAAPREDDLSFDDLGHDAKMPWETNGRQWHTRDRVSRSGELSRWDGRILEIVADRIQELGGFDATEWANRATVRITGQAAGLRCRSETCSTRVMVSSGWNASSVDAAV
jgi:hypothetical protein